MIAKLGLDGAMERTHVFFEAYGIKFLHHLAGPKFAQVPPS
jgi:hypothetical protein